MLVIVSDLHLSDGSTSNNVDPSVFTDVLFREIVLNALKDRAKEIRLVLLREPLFLLRHASFDALKVAVSLYNAFDRVFPSGVDDYVKGARASPPAED